MPNLTTFASREPATYIRGEVNPEGWKTTADMLSAAHLSDWNVRLRPLESDARTAKVTYEVVRTNPFDGGIDRLGVAGERYGIVQNEQALAMFDDLAPVWEAAGSFKNGSLIYAQAKTEKSSSTPRVSLTRFSRWWSSPPLTTARVPCASVARLSAWTASTCSMPFSETFSTRFRFVTR
jgi:hypothetical protein